MRLFAAILPPPGVAEELAAVVHSRLAGLPGAERLRWTERDGWHITLAYYGETPQELVAGVGERLAAVARRQQPFALRLAGTESLRGWALGAGVAGDRNSLAALAAAGAAVSPEAERYDTYRPHLTVALNTRDGDPVSFDPYALALRGFAGAPWQVSEVVLMSSARESGESRRYATLAAWPLGD